MELSLCGIRLVRAEAYSHSRPVFPDSYAMCSLPRYSAAGVSITVETLQDTDLDGYIFQALQQVVLTVLELLADQHGHRNYQTNPILHRRLGQRLHKRPRAI